VSFINNILGKTQDQRKKNLVTIIYITTAVVLLLTIAIIATLIADRADKAPDDTSDNGNDPSLQAVTKSFDLSDTKKGTLLIINKNTAKYDFTLNPESNLKLLSSSVPNVGGTPAYTLRKDDLKATPDAINALNQMTKAFVQQNTDSSKKLTVWTAYRSEELQNSLGSSVAGGHSDFHTGMLFELTVNDSSASIGSDAAFKWIYDNAHKYGFIARYPEAKSAITGVSNFDNAFRYVGVAHATYMKTNGLCLEEYVTLLQQSNGQTFSAGGYVICYVRVGASGSTEITLPSASATVSGDNMGGLIIAAKQ